MVVLLEWHQRLTAKCHRMVASIFLFLREHHTKPFLRGICLKEERFIKVREHKHCVD